MDLQDGGSAVLCGANFSSTPEHPATQSDPSPSISMLFDVDEPVSPGQIVRLNANGAVEPYRPFKHVVLKNGRQHARYTTTICSLGLKEVHVLPDAPVLTYARAATCRVLAYARATTCPVRSSG